MVLGTVVLKSKVTVKYVAETCKKYKEFIEIFLYFSMVIATIMISGTYN